MRETANIEQKRQIDFCFENNFQLLVENKYRKFGY